MNWDNVPPQQQPVERQHQVIKTKTIGSAVSDAPAHDSFKAKLEAIARAREKDSSGGQADKAKAETLDRAGEMRHLKYEVIDEAAIVQVSVIKTEDGTVVRKVPPDKVVGLIERMRKNRKRTGGNSLDMKL